MPSRRILALAALLFLSCQKNNPWDVVGWLGIGEYAKERIFDLQPCAGSEFWYASTKGLFRVRGNGVEKESEKITLLVKSFDTECKEIWTVDATSRTLVRSSTVSDDLAHLATPRDEDLTGVNALAASDDRRLLWIGTDEALLTYLCDGEITDGGVCSGDWARQSKEDFEVKYLLVDGENLWAANSRQVAVFNTGESAAGHTEWSKAEELLQGLDIVRLAEADGRIWLTTLSGGNPSFAWSVERGASDIEAVSKTNKKVLAVAACKGATYFGTTDGLFKSTESGKSGDQSSIAREELTLQESAPAPVNAVVCIDDETWFSAGYDVWSDQAPLRVFGGALSPVNAAISTITEEAGHRLAWGTGGVVRFCDAKIRLDTSIISNPVLPSVGLSLGRIIRVKDVGYVDRPGESCVPASPSARDSLDVFMGLGLSELEARLEKKRPISIDGEFGKEVGPGVFSVYFQVQDKNENVLLKKTYDSVYSMHEALSPLVSFGFWAILLSWTIALVGLFFSPWNLLAMSVVDSRFFRTRISFGFIPSALLLGPLRRHVLRRYRRHLASHCEWRVREDSDQPVAASLRSMVDLLARGFVVTVSCGNRCPHLFRGLPLSFCEKKRRSAFFPPSSLWRRPRKSKPGLKRLSELRKAIPVYLSLNSYLMQDQSDSTLNDLIGAVLGEFSNFGDINDSKLGRYFLDQGGFIFFLEGYDQLKSRGKHVVQTFINRYDRENFFVVGMGGGDTAGPELHSLTRALDPSDATLQPRTRRPDDTQPRDDQGDLAGTAPSEATSDEGCSEDDEPAV